MTIKDILTGNRIVAMVGLSDNPQRASYGVAHYLIDHGYMVIPVNPMYTEIQEQKCYPDLLAIPQKVDIVDIFRKSEEVMPFVDDAIKINAKVVWMQLGVVNEEAAVRARNAGLEVVMDTCIMAQHHSMTSGGEP